MGALQLKRIEGHPCPNCGCQQSEVVSTETWWGKPREKRECRHCETRFSAEVSVPPAKSEEQAKDAAGERKDAVRYRPIRCPECGSKRTRTTKTKAPIRYHRCQICKHTFKSFEE